MVWSPGNEWKWETLKLVFRVAPGPGELPALSTTPQSLWLAPGKVAVRGAVAYADQADPMASGDGATSLLVGLDGTGTNIADLLVAMTLGHLGTGQVGGWGIRGAKAPGGVNGPNPNGAGGVILIPEGSEDGTNPHDGTRNGISAKCDSGTMTGTLFLEFEWRPL